ncbi:iron-containing redox enzyme family protein [Gordonia polyisoprenivorans]|uniref:iron-containing redox enzyme family protein n=1 Tax=Gordonia polyisoprenivorans TaxID=84595 RepID=UPI0003A1E412|nr:iron-containing redox enzyme family protein [Gordonia polyisoprenivorans]
MAPPAPTSQCPMLEPHGALGDAVATLLRGDPTARRSAKPAIETALDNLPTGPELLADLDAQRTWFTLAELGGRGVIGVEDGWDEHPHVAAVRTHLGDALERAIRVRIGPVNDCTAEDLAMRIRTELAELDSPPLSAHLRSEGTIEQYRDLLRHRSIYHLREADPHTTAIPRLTGQAKAGLVEIQNDEYGCGRIERMHATLFARTMSALGLDSGYAAYVNTLPAVTLAWVNALTLFASRRRLRGAIVGHLLALESTSSLPNKRYAEGLRRLGFDSAATMFFDEHVEADAVHEQIALHDMAIPFLHSEPWQSVELLTGFRAAILFDADVGHHLLRSWNAARS